MTIKEIILEANKIVSYPWSKSKIKKAKIDPAKFLKEIAEKLKNADDYDPDNKLLMKIIKEAKQL